MKKSAMRPHCARLASLLFALGQLACGSSEKTSVGGANANANANEGATSDSIPGGAVNVQNGCGMQTFSVGASRVNANVMLVVDKSGSMGREKADDNSATRWDAAKQAVLDLVAGNSTVHWGLSLFSAGAQDSAADAAQGIPVAQSSCKPGQIDVAIGDATSAAIVAKISPFTSQLVESQDVATPTAATLRNLLAANAFTDASRTNAIVLITDGIPNCGRSNDPTDEGAEVTEAIEALAGNAVPIRSYVIGFGNSVNQAATLLSSWAVAGGTARAGALAYYAAGNQSDLQSAFADIAGNVASCVYKLADKPADPSLLVTYLANKAVPNDATDGATYDDATQSVTFHGTACDEIKSGAQAQLQIVYGCPAPVVQ